MIWKRTLLLLLLLLAACAAADAPGNAERGAKLFSGTTLIAGGNAPDCLSCHPIRPGQTSNIGTNLSNIGLRAEHAVAGQSAEQYLRTAILDPDAYLAGGFQEGIMYRQYRQALSPQDVSDLVAYLRTLRSGQD